MRLINPCEAFFPSMCSILFDSGMITEPLIPIIKFADNRIQENRKKYKSVTEFAPKKKAINKLVKKIRPFERMLKAIE